MRISRLLYREDKWCKGCMGITKNGIHLQQLNIVHYENGHTLDPSKEIVAYSLYGAITHLYNQDTQNEIFQKVGNAIREYTGVKIYLAEWNDLPTTTYKDVMAVLRKAGL
jgi:hypothetical protein